MPQVVATCRLDQDGRLRLHQLLGPDPATVWARPAGQGRLVLTRDGVSGMGKVAVRYDGTRLHLGTGMARWLGAAGSPVLAVADRQRVVLLAADVAASVVAGRPPHADETGGAT
jgi:hypothetical protein